MSDEEYKKVPTSGEIRKKIFKIIYFIFYIAVILQMFMLLAVRYEEGKITNEMEIAIPVVVLIYGTVLIYKQLFKFRRQERG